MIKHWENQTTHKAVINRQLIKLMANLPIQLTAPLIRRLSSENSSLNNLLLSQKLKEKSEILMSSNLQNYYRNAISYWPCSEQLLNDVTPSSSVFSDLHTQDFCSSEYQQLMLLDTCSYLPDDILVKVDRAGMAHSLESRIPMLNHNIMEFSASIPS